MSEAPKDGGLFSSRRHAEGAAVMTKPTTLAEAWDQRAAEATPASPAPTPQAQSRRDFYAGALAALVLLRSGREPAALFAELAQYGRTVGSPIERAA